MARRDAAALASLGSLADRVRPVVLARDRQLPVLPALEPLLPGGALARGSVVAVGAAAGASGTTSLALALAAGAARAGSWVATVGLGSLGLVAADQLGLALDRLVLVDEPAPGASSVGWAPVVAALVDGFDVVLVAAGPGVRRRAGDVRRLVARVRERGAVLVAVGGDLPGHAATVRLTVAAAAWEGLGERERGHLHRRRVTVAASGRGEASRPRRADLWLPDGRGRVAAAEPVATPLPRRERRDGRDAGAAGSTPGALVGVAGERVGRGPMPPVGGDVVGEDVVGVAG
ncbi:MAG TPA: hypothetical protein VIL48_06065 [Acidimicrobiales bacterium]